LAQLVNVIAPIMTETGGPAWRQTTFHPFAEASRYGRGRVLQPQIQSGTYAAKTYPEISHVGAAVVDDRSTGQTAIFALNRHRSETIELVSELRGLGKNRRLVSATELHHADLKAINSRECPDTVAPRPNRDVAIDGEEVRVRLKPLSWNVIVTSAAN
jgi:alpha-N-arabinofuranosidase